MAYINTTGPTGPFDPVTVSELKAMAFNALSLEEKVLVRNRGRPTPDLTITEEGISKGKRYKRMFNRSIYDEADSHLFSDF